jgi:hypothetical protein
MTRVLEDKTRDAEVLAEAERAGQYRTVQWGVMFLGENNRELCREMGLYHGFNDLESAREWVKRITPRAYPGITAFYVFAW